MSLDHTGSPCKGPIAVPYTFITLLIGTLWVGSKKTAKCAYVLKGWPLIFISLFSIEDEEVIAGDVGARLGNTAQRMALGKGKKATYAAEKKA